MNLEAMSDKAILGELGGRLQRERLNRNLTQADLALKSGVSIRSIQYLETGHPCTLASLIKILRALGNLTSLDAFFPEPGMSPVQLARLKGRERQRASGSKRDEKG
ncbi:MAG: helix-turn-helix domain-containing protein [Candidatus Aminicenantes bacterium]|nr:helix-turn-helix domain-containing protein [Candidatus Aminicenantes bacterium]